MNIMYPNDQSPGAGGAQAPKRSNSGREIVYIQNQRLIGSGQAVQDSFLSPPPQSQMQAPTIPAEVAEVFNNVLRKYAYRDIHRWLKIDRQDEINRFSTTLRQGSSDNISGHASRPSMASMASSARTSRTSSVFSMPSKYERNSFASTNTTYSIMSEPSMPSDHGTPIASVSPEEMQIAHTVALDQKTTANLIHNSPANKASRHTTAPVPKPSARQRESELEVKKRYYCTACNKGFARKYDWKVHEQRYHEQQAQYPCPDCNQVLYAETHFRSHHRDAHGCQQCTHAKEVTREVDPRRRRTAWGCGFCGQLLDDWEKRCDHISAHYDEGLKRADWDHSKVIIGLLRQSDLDSAWQTLLISKHGQHPNPPLMFRWSKETTARSHGDNLQLQDLLELGAIGRNVQSIVQSAYEQGYRPPSDNSIMTLPTVGESDESDLSPPDAPQDSVMASPVPESTTVPHSATQSYYMGDTHNMGDTHITSPMSYTPQPQQHDIRRTSMALTPAPMDNWNTFSDAMFQNTTYMPNHHQSMATYADKALPPLPQTPVDTDMGMLHPSSSGDAQPNGFETWSMLTGTTTYSEDTNGMIVAAYDPSNQF